MTTQRELVSLIRHDDALVVQAYAALSGLYAGVLSLGEDTNLDLRIYDYMKRARESMDTLQERLVVLKP